MVAYTKPQQRKREESERLRGETVQIKFIYLRFEKWQVVRFGKNVTKKVRSSLQGANLCPKTHHAVQYKRS